MGRGGPFQQQQVSNSLNSFSWWSWTYSKFSLGSNYVILLNETDLQQLLAQLQWAVLSIFHHRKSVSLLPNMCMYIAQTSANCIFIISLRHICQADSIKWTCFHLQRDFLCMQNASRPNEALVIRKISRMNQGENEKSTELVTVSRFNAGKTVSPGFWKCLLYSVVQREDAGDQSDSWKHLTVYYL